MSGELHMALCTNCFNVPDIPSKGYCPHCGGGPAMPFYLPADLQGPSGHSKSVERSRVWKSTPRLLEQVIAPIDKKAPQAIHGTTPDMIIEAYERLRQRTRHQPLQWRVAEILNVTVSTLYRRMQALDMHGWPPSRSTARVPSWTAVASALEEWLRRS